MGALGASCRRDGGLSRACPSQVESLGGSGHATSYRFLVSVRWTELNRTRTKS